MKDKYYLERRRLVERLVREGILKSRPYIEAMLKVPRHEFVWPTYREYAYVDHALPLGNTGQTISAPHMCAYMMEELGAMPGDYVLEIGSGSGYQAALLAEVVAPDDMDRSRWGHVTSIEIVRELVEYARENIERCGLSDKVKILHGDGALGYPPFYEGEVYDRIIVTAAAPRIPPMLIKQLKRGGTLVIPIGNLYMQELTVVVKDEAGRIRSRKSVSCMFVPLTGRCGWRRGGDIE
jgi:protein-L-isoaspartate(D-aspartate) O-methyltransferase